MHYFIAGMALLVTSMFVSSGINTILSIGKPRAPINHAAAVVIVIVCILTVWLLLELFCAELALGAGHLVVRR